MKKVKFKNEKEIKLLKSIVKRYLIKHIDECELAGKIELLYKLVDTTKLEKEFNDRELKILENVFHDYYSYWIDDYNEKSKRILQYVALKLEPSLPDKDEILKRCKNVYLHFKCDGKILWGSEVATITDETQLLNTIKHTPIIKAVGITSEEINQIKRDYDTGKYKLEFENLKLQKRIDELERKNCRLRNRIRELKEEVK